MFHVYLKTQELVEEMMSFDPVFGFLEEGIKDVFSLLASRKLEESSYWKREGVFFPTSDKVVHHVLELYDNFVITTDRENTTSHSVEQNRWLIGTITSEIVEKFNANMAINLHPYLNAKVSRSLRRIKWEAYEMRVDFTAFEK